MDKITMEYMDNMIMESFHETGSDDVLSRFSDSLNSNISALEENGMELDDQVIIFLSSIITAQTNAINTIRGVLYKIFCKNEEETKHTTNGGSEHAQNQ